MSKLLEYPTFKPLPPYTDAANVPENIDNWLKKKNKESIKNYLIKVEGNDYHKGYRFITAADLREIIYTRQLIRNVWIEVIFVRHYKNNDRLSPLSFGVWYTDIILKSLDFQGLLEMYKSDAQLKRFCSQIKNSKTVKG